MKTWDMKLPIKLREAGVVAMIGKLKRNINELEIQISNLIDTDLNNELLGPFIDEQIELYDALYQMLDEMICEKQRLKEERKNNIC